VPDTADLNIADGWRLELLEDRLRLSKNGDQTYELPRATVLERLERLWLHFEKPFFTVREPRRRVFKLSADQAAVLDRWLGPDFKPELYNQLRLRTNMALPMGLLFIVTNSESIFSWFLGGLMIVQAVLKKFRPSHYIFLLEIAFWGALVARNGWLVAVSLQSKTTTGAAISVVLGLLSAFFLWMSLRTFLRFQKAFAAPRT
jgi:hypothetical protein